MHAAIIRSRAANDSSRFSQPSLSQRRSPRRSARATTVAPSRHHAGHHLPAGVLVPEREPGSRAPPSPYLEIRATVRAESRLSPLSVVEAHMAFLELALGLFPLAASMHLGEDESCPARNDESDR